MLSNDIISQIFLGFISFLSNFISALSGGGAGLIQLPALIFFGLPFSKALATHKVASVALGFGASVPHLKKNNLQIKYAFLILISGLPGVLLGAYTSSILPNNFSNKIVKADEPNKLKVSPNKAIWDLTGYIALSNIVGVKGIQNTKKTRVHVEKSET